MAIDDEIDSIKRQYPESQSNLALSLTLKLLSILPGGSGLVVKLSEVLRSHFSTRAMEERLRLLFDALERMVYQAQTASAVLCYSRLLFSIIY